MNRGLESVRYERVKANLTALGYIISQHMLRKAAICYLRLAEGFFREESVCRADPGPEG